MPLLKKIDNTQETFIIVMPSLNEEAYIEETLTSWATLMNECIGSEILVVDGGSKDKTVVKIKNLEESIPALHLLRVKSKMYGHALQAGYRHATKSNHEWVFQTDSDGHFEPSDFYKLWRKRKSSNFIIGRRYKRQDGVHRIILARMIELWIYMLFGLKIKDSNTPFRLMNRMYLGKMLDQVPKNTIAPNIFLSIFAKKDGQNLYHVPVKHRQRKKDEYNNLKLLKGALLGFAELLFLRLRLV